MKFTLTYYLLLLYSMVILNPVIPIVSDAISHSFAEAAHVAKVHAKYGANHLQMELSGTASEKDQHKKNMDEQAGTHLPVCLMNEMTCTIYTNQQFVSPPVFSFKDICLKNVSPPPKEV